MAGRQRRRPRASDHAPQAGTARGGGAEGRATPPLDPSLEVPLGAALAALQSAPVLLVTTRGPEHVFTSVNPAYAQVVGRPRTALLGRRVRDALPELGPQRGLALLDYVYRTGRPHAATEVPLWLDRDGTGVLQERSFSFAYAPMRGPDDQVVGLVCVGVEVTAQVRERAHLRALLDAAADLAATLDRDEILRRLATHLVNALGAALAAMTAVDLTTRRCKSLVYHARAGVAPAFSADPWEDLALYPELEAVLRTRIPFQGRVDDPAFPAHERAYLTRHGFAAEVLVPLIAHDTALGVLEVQWTTPRDITTAEVALAQAIAEQAGVALEQARLHAEALERAGRDALTGLPNRTVLLDRLSQAVLAAARDGRALALLVLDLDRFKWINDTRGHHQGDRVLQVVAARLSATLRASDTVARLGGDEFAVLLLETEGAGAVAAAEKVAQALAPPVVLDGDAYHVGASVGIAVGLAHGTDAGTLLRAADAAMYVAKRERRGPVLYDPVLGTAASARLVLAQDLRQALATGALRLHYQPQLDLSTGMVHGVEALTRWTHPQQGAIGPDTFIPLAEEAGLIGTLTRWVLEEALKQVRAWQAAGLALVVQVNVSALDLRDPSFAPDVVAMLARHQVEGAWLRLELTESALMDDPVQGSATLAHLATQGVHVVIDDFGTGYSSLAYLSRLAPQELKIDRGFVQRLRHVSADATIVTSIIGLGRGLGLAVVAEGVEDAATLELLRAWGCTAVQGYYVARPLPATEVEAWVRQWSLAG